MELNWRDIVRKNELLALIFSVSAIGVFFLLPLVTSLSLGLFLSILSSLGTAIAITGIVYTGSLRVLEQDATEENFIEEAREANKVVAEHIKNIDEAEEELTEYKRITRVLDEKDVDPSRILDNQTNSSKFLLMVFADQEGPVHDEYSEDDEDTRFIRWAIKNNFDAITVSPYTWLIPPEVIEEEGLEQADKEEIENWIDKHIYERYEEEYTAHIRLASIVDFQQTHSRADTDGASFGTIVEKVIDESESFTDDRYLEAIAHEEINLLDVVKNGNLAFFLPRELDENAVEMMQERQETVVAGLAGDGLRALANPENIGALAGGLEEIGVSQAESIAEDIVEEASVWKDRINTA